MGKQGHLKKNQKVTITYTRSQVWSSLPDQSEPEVAPSDEPRKIPSRQNIRDMALAKGNEPSYKCPACGGRFILEFSVFGRLPESFSESCFWCPDCATLNQIVKVR